MKKAETEIEAPEDAPLIIVRRRFRAPPELVFRAWTDTELLRQWWLGPEGMVMIRCEIDARTGGTWRMEQQDRDGNVYAFYGEYLDFDPPRGFSQTFRMDMDGLRDPPIKETLAFAEDGDGTLVTARSLCPSMEARTGMMASGMEEGMNASFARLVDVLASESGADAFTIDRVFDAPVDLVWQCFTRTEHVERWMVPDGFEIVEQQADLTVGGTWQTHMRHPDQGDWHVGGTYRKIDANRWLVFTHKWTDTPNGPGDETLVTIEFADRGDRTHMRFTHDGFADRSTRDGHRGGWLETLAHLEDHLATLAEAA
ncbi:MAG: SRPBCC domain-containing protein [Roseitalea sp.]|nr:SRPBCC domain-containing protein [Roseitalea sp.]MBO6721310.1 SRPBCC domain-containing protein [Roseitalea sp.]MBO6742205.1 SRPBCC domain-containing protein [Roseitalea sp.]